MYIIMLIFGNPVGGTQTLKYGGSVTSSFSQVLFKSFGFACAFAAPSGPFASSVCS